MNLGTQSEHRLLVATLLLGFVSGGCSIGEGTGSLNSPQLLIEDCWNEPFQLEPTFFAANPYGDDLTIRIQRGEESTLVSDGVSLLIHNITDIRETQLGQQLPLALPIGITPLGFSAPDIPRLGTANLTLYLNDSCPGKNATLSAVGGWVMFEQLFSGNPNENNSEDRLTVGSFEAIMIDPRDAIARDNPGPGELPYIYPSEIQSELSGEFRFVFHRGTPAQPFP